MSEKYNEELILDYLEGDLDADARIRFEQQMRKDARLRWLVEQLQNDRQMLRSSAVETVPPQVLEQVNGQLERRILLDRTQATDGSPVVARIGRYVGYGAVAAMVLIGATWIALSLWSPPAEPLPFDDDAFVVVEDRDQPTPEDNADLLIPPGPGEGETGGRTAVADAGDVTPAGDDPPALVRIPTALQWDTELGHREGDSMASALVLVDPSDVLRDEQGDAPPDLDLAELLRQYDDLAIAATDVSSTDGRDPQRGSLALLGQLANGDEPEDAGDAVVEPDPADREPAVTLTIVTADALVARQRVLAWATTVGATNPEGEAIRVEPATFDLNAMPAEPAPLDLPRRAAEPIRLLVSPDHLPQLQQQLESDSLAAVQGLAATPADAPEDEARLDSLIAGPIQVQPMPRTADQWAKLFDIDLQRPAALVELRFQSP